jgi:hypothetical protein
MKCINIYFHDLCMIECFGGGGGVFPLEGDVWGIVKAGKSLILLRRESSLLSSYFLHYEFEDMIKLQFNVTIISFFETFK